MNASRSLKSIFLAAVVLAAASGFATSKGSLELQHPTNVAGNQLASGNYSVQWEGTGDQVELKIYQGKKAVASTAARVINLEQPQPHDAAVMVTNGDGSASLSRIMFRGRKYAIEISNQGGTAGAAGAAR